MRTASRRARTLVAGVTVAGFAISVNAWAQAQPIVLPGEPPDLVMFYTGDVVGYLTPCG